MNFIYLEIRRPADVCSQKKYLGPVRHDCGVPEFHFVSHLNGRNVFGVQFSFLILCVCVPVAFVRPVASPGVDVTTIKKQFQCLISKEDGGRAIVLC